MNILSFDEGSLITFGSEYGLTTDFSKVININSRNYANVWIYFRALLPPKVRRSNCGKHIFQVQKKALSDRIGFKTMQGGLLGNLVENLQIL